MIIFHRPKHLIALVFSLEILLFFSSCGSYKQVPYFQNIPSDTGVIYKSGIKIPTTEIADIRIQENDILNIDIKTINPDLNIVNGSDQSRASTVIANASTANGNSNSVSGYLVDANGEIELPITGKIKVIGLTTAEARELIGERSKAYYKDPVVNVRIANFKVTVIGEVAQPGAYLINGERVSILDAIGQAGDLTIYGLRKNVLLSRRENGHQTLVRFDLTSSDIYSSPYFYLRQGDVIYVQPSKGKSSANDAAMLRYYALVTSTLSLVVVLAARL